MEQRETMSTQPYRDDEKNDGLQGEQQWQNCLTLTQMTTTSKHCDGDDEDESALRNRP